VKIIEVLKGHDRKEFHNFPKRLYSDDPNWISPFDSVIEAIFDPSKNHSFEHGEAARWILIDENNKIIGRIAAFVDHVRSAANRQPTGGLGFFEVIEEKEAAFKLFDTAKEWLSLRGMEAMDGPINFGENDSFWGLLVDGFMPQSYGMPYNKKYYRDFFESYGFRNYFDQYSYHRTIRGTDNKIEYFPDRIMKVAEWLTKRPGYTFSHFEFRNSRKYMENICEIYNTTWIYLKDDFTPLVPSILDESLQKAKPVLDEELVWFAYYNNKPIGFFILLPDLNQILRHLNGKLQVPDMIKFVYYKLTHEMTRIRAIVGGVLRSHQNTGVEAAIFFKLYEVFKRKPWLKELELSWVGDYNPKMLATYEALGAKKAKTHITYRYLINDNLKFIRYKDEMTEKQEIKEKDKQKDQ
jgi:hypothetical protein